VEYLRIPTFSECAQDVFNRLEVVHKRWIGIGGLQRVPHCTRGILNKSGDFVPSASLIVQLHQLIHIYVVTAQLVGQLKSKLCQIQNPKFDYLAEGPADVLPLHCEWQVVFFNKPAPWA